MLMPGVVLPAFQLELICEALHIIIIAGAKNTGMPVQAAQEALDILSNVIYADLDPNKALVNLQNLQKGDDEHPG